MLLFFSLDDPFWLYRWLITLVMGGIYLYTVFESIAFVISMLSGRKEEAEAAAQARAELAEAIDLSASVPTLAKLSKKVRTIKFDVDSAQLIRIAKKLAILKASQMVSIDTLRLMWREAALVFLLLVANGATLYVFYDVLPDYVTK